MAPSADTIECGRVEAFVKNDLNWIEGSFLPENKASPSIGSRPSSMA